MAKCFISKASDQIYEYEFEINPEESVGSFFKKLTDKYEESFVVDYHTHTGNMLVVVYDDYLEGGEGND